MALNLQTETLLSGDPPQVQPALPPEQIAPHFPQLEILECLGRGGMGVVYKARQKALNRLVALKLLAPERVNDPKFAERFTREAQALAALSHPNIVTIHDFGQAGGYYFLLMEYVDGANLRQLLRTRKFTPEEALAIVPPLCDALQYAHEHGIVHRDIKPENILLDKAGHVKVADFGIARMLGTAYGESAGTASQPENLTQSIVGTPSYSAPEQKTDPRSVDNRADIYSLGVVLYEMLTGELPGKPITPPSRKVVIDVRLDEIVLRALENEPERRYQQASIFKTQVEMIAEAAPETPSAASPSSKNKPLLADFLNFQSKLAARIFALSGFGGLGALSIVPGWERFAAFFAFFGFIGIGILIEIIYRKQNQRPPTLSTPESNPATLLTPAELERFRWIILVRGLILCIVAAVFGIHLHPSILGVALTSWGLLGFLVVSWKSRGTRRGVEQDRKALKTANQIGLIHAIGVFAAGTFLALINSGLDPVWNTFLAILMGCAVIVCLLRLFGVFAWLWKNGRKGLALILAALVFLLSFTFVSHYPEPMSAMSVRGASYVSMSLQSETADIQPDRTIRFQETITIQNATGRPVLTEHFINSDFVHLEKITDSQGRTVAFTTTHKGDHFEYNLTLNEPVQPGEAFSGTMEGTITGLVKPMGEPGVFQYEMRHWPGVNGMTRRIEVHRLPPGAELLQKSPADLLQQTTPDGRIELRIDRLIPEKGSLEVRYRYRLARLQINSQPSATSPAFGPVREAILKVEEISVLAVNLETGKTALRPRFSREGTENEAAWMRGMDMDLWGDIQERGAVVVCCNMAVMPVDDAQWQQMGADELLHDPKLAAISPPLKVIEPGPTLAFRTRTGKVGMLQILGLTDDRRGVKIRYKLVQRTADNALTAQFFSSQNRTDKNIVEDQAL